MTCGEGAHSTTHTVVVRHEFDKAKHRLEKTPLKVIEAHWITR